MPPWFINILQPSTNPDIIARLTRIETGISQVVRMMREILTQEHHMAQELDDLTAAVGANSVLLDSAVVLINGIADRIAAAGADPVKLAALTAELRAHDDALAAAVAANTPST
jgi:hypothetical protein